MFDVIGWTERCVRARTKFGDPWIFHLTLLLHWRLRQDCISRCMQWRSVWSSQRVAAVRGSFAASQDRNQDPHDAPLLPPSFFHHFFPAGLMCQQRYAWSIISASCPESLLPLGPAYSPEAVSHNDFCHWICLVLYNIFAMHLHLNLPCFFHLTYPLLS